MCVEIRKINGVEIGRKIVSKEVLSIRRKKLIDSGFKFIGNHASHAVRGKYSVEFVPERKEKIPSSLVQAVAITLVAEGMHPIGANYTAKMGATLADRTLTPYQERIAALMPEAVSNAQKKSLKVRRRKTVKPVPPVPVQKLSPIAPSRMASDFGEITSTQSQMLKDEAEYNAAFAKQEKEQEEEAFLSDPDYRRSLPEKVVANGGEPQIAQAVLAKSRKIEDAAYTVVHPDGYYRTLRIRTPETGGLAGKTIVQYLVGPDNTSQYAGCAFYNQEKGRATMWKKFHDNRDFCEEILSAVGVVLENPAKAGEAYTIRSGRCCKCGRKLTVPSSLHMGMGPDCAANSGW